MILSKFPNYANAISVPEIDASLLDEKTFRRDYVEKNKPVIIRKATKHWKNLQTWNLETVKSKMSDVKDMNAHGCLILTKPLREYVFPLGSEKQQLIQAQKKSGKTVSSADFFERLEKGERISAMSVRFNTPGIEPIKQDIESFSFLGDPFQYSTITYQPRFFIHQGGYTDWHFHFTDESVTVQAVWY